MNVALKRLTTALVGLAAALAASLTLASQPAAAAATGQSSAASLSACWFAAYPPNKEGSLLRAWGEKWDCSPSAKWTITLQRHRTGGWWQNEGHNSHQGNGWVSVPAGCVPGQWTYRTILESNQGWGCP